MSVYIYILVYIYVGVYIYTDIYVCMYIYIYEYFFDIMNILQLSRSGSSTQGLGFTGLPCRVPW